MTTPIVATQQYVTLVGGGEMAGRDLAEAMELAPVLVAADSGADAALAQGYSPAAVIGDLDSISDDARRRVPTHRLHRICEQDTTDFDKALRSISAPLVLAVGFLGARIDHQLAAFNTLVRRPERPCLLIDPGHVVFLAPPHIRIGLDPGDVVSLFPMRGVTGRSTGLAWPIDGLDLEPHGRIGTSNRALGPVTIDAECAGLLVILPRRALPAAVAALGSASPGWADSNGATSRT